MPKVKANGIEIYYEITGSGQPLVLASSTFSGPHHIPVTPEAMAVLTDLTGDPVKRMRRRTAVAFAAGFAEAHPDIVEELTAYRLSVPVPPEAYQAQLAVGLALLDLLRGAA